MNSKISTGISSARTVPTRIISTRMIPITIISTLILAALLFATGAVAQEPITLEATEDVYVDLRDGQVYDTQILRCKLDAGNGTIPGIPLVQFDVSGVNLTEDSMVILALRASLVDRRDLGPTGIAVLLLSTGWNETSNSTEMARVLEPLKSDLMEGFDDIDEVTSVRHAPQEDDAWIFVFDVYKALRTPQDGIAFALVPINEVGYTVDFRSRETGEGPVLLIMDFPKGEISGQSPS